MSTVLDLEKLMESKLSRSKVKQEVFDKILCKCQRHIIFVNHTKRRDECYYKIPVFIGDLPSYPSEEIGRYMVEHLIKNGLYASLKRFAGGVYVYISWKPTDINIKKYWDKIDSDRFSYVDSSKVAPKRVTYKSNVRVRNNPLNKTISEDIISLPPPPLPSRRKSNIDNKTEVKSDNSESGIMSIQLGDIKDYIPINIKKHYQALKVRNRRRRDLNEEISKQK